MKEITFPEELKAEKDAVEILRVVRVVKDEDDQVHVSAELCKEVSPHRWGEILGNIMMTVVDGAIETGMLAEEERARCVTTILCGLRELVESGGGPRHLVQVGQKKSESPDDG